MKKIFYSLAALLLIFTSCQDDLNESKEDQTTAKINMDDFYVYTYEEDEGGKSASDARTCHSMKVLNEELKKNPGLEKKMYNIEKHLRKAIAFKGKPSKPGNGNGNGGGGGGSDPTPFEGTITIPVIVNILENSSGDVTNAQVSSQIAILNEDFNNNNPNTGNAPAEFAGLVADADITFTLAGVNRKISSNSSWGTNNAMKDSGQGGIDATDPTTYLNIWVCNIGGGILGYAQFPGGSLATDGVVIGNDYFGETSGPYGDGRTATHEVGHWLNLRHIWGDGRCKQDDFVADTPSSDRSNGGCPAYPTVHCRSADMTMNYMDYVYDDCMYMFTNGQNDRMRALFAAGGSKESFVN